MTCFLLALETDGREKGVVHRRVPLECIRPHDFRPRINEVHGKSLLVQDDKKMTMARARCHRFVM